MHTGESENAKVCRTCISAQNESVSTLWFHYLAGSPEGVVRFFEDHSLALRSVEEMLDAFREAVVAGEHDSLGLDGRGLSLGSPFDP